MRGTIRPVQVSPASRLVHIAGPFCTRVRRLRRGAASLSWIDQSLYSFVFEDGSTSAAGSERQYYEP